MAAIAAGVALTLGVAATVITSRVSGDLRAGRDGVQRSLGQALARGERDDERLVVELTGDELARVVTDGLTSAGLVVDELEVAIRAADRPDRGRLQVSGALGDGHGRFTGRAGVGVVDGRLRLDMDHFRLTGYRLPGVARSAAGDLIAEAATVGPYLAERGLQLADVAFADDLMRLVAVPLEGDEPGPPSATAGKGEAAAGEDGDAAPPAAADVADVAAGVVDTPMVDGEPTVLVVGDSVAAGVGVDDFAHSYAAQLHGWLQRRDDADYGLTDLAVPGETSWSLRRQGQLDRALAVLADTAAALIVVDIGANDLLSALEHPACADDITTDRCRALIDGRLADYQASFDATLGDLRGAAPQAPMVVMTTYNPFSFGGGGDFEARSEAAVADLNAVATRVARRHGARVADGAAPLRGRAGQLTHMGGGGPPDVHPTAAGYDALTGALIEAVRRPAPPPRAGGHALPAHPP